MNKQVEIDIKNYVRVEKAIAYIRENHQSQPSLKEVSKALHLSEYYFQKVFLDWAGVSPKKFLQYISN